MQTVSFPQFAAPVIMYFDEQYNKAAFHVRIEDDEIILRGDRNEIYNAAGALCHVFKAQIDANVHMPNDFFGMITRDERLKWPKGRVELKPRQKHNNKLVHIVFVQVDERSINMAFESFESAIAVAKGLAEFLGLIQKKKPNEFSGSLKFEPHVQPEPQ